MAVARLCLGLLESRACYWEGGEQINALRDRSNGRFAAGFSFPFCWRHFAFAWR
jgi:hypothetical protein